MLKKLYQKILQYLIPMVISFLEALLKKYEQPNPELISRLKKLGLRTKLLK